MKVNSYYQEDFLQNIITYFNDLQEKSRRYFLGLEYKRFGRGSARYLARVFGCSRDTIRKGYREISKEGFNADYTYQRETGAGRKKKEVSIPDLTTIIIEHVSKYTAGSPTDINVKWTHLRPRDISIYLQKEKNIKASNSQIKRILRDSGYCKRKPAKVLACGKSPHREEQFRIICFTLSLFMLMSNNPIMSMDTKKKEDLGYLTRNDPILCKLGIPVKVFDHDFSFLITGRAIPWALYDIKQNKGFISIGNSHETASFVIDNLRWWWENYGINDYPDSTTILILCDSGGANGYRHHLYKKLLLDFAREIGKRILIVHYPPYCSKYNPIERRLFCHVHRTIQNVILTDIQQVKELMMKTSTSTGLNVVVRIQDKEYPVGERSCKEDLDQTRILTHPVLPKFSYTILP